MPPYILICGCPQTNNEGDNFINVFQDVCTNARGGGPMSNEITIILISNASSAPFFPSVISVSLFSTSSPLDHEIGKNDPDRRHQK